MMKIIPENTIVAIFSYNKACELENLILSIISYMPEFKIILYDDHSDNLETLDVIEKYKSHFIKVVKTPATTMMNRKCGGLYRNIRHAYDYACEHNYEYLFFLQDDMQITRAVNQDILNEYSNLFNHSENIIQIDTRYIRKNCAVDIHHLNDKGFYSYKKDDARRGYADVGLLSVKRLQDNDWVFLSSEGENKKQACQKGLRRVFPFRPICMHVIFPTLYRLKQKVYFDHKIWGRGKFGYKALSDKQIKNFDNRPVEKIPFPKKYLAIRGYGLLRIAYIFFSDKKKYGGNSTLYKLFKGMPFSNR